MWTFRELSMSYRFKDLEHSCWGHSSFVPWVDVMDSRKGYSRGDAITIEAVIEVDPPLFFKTARVYSNAPTTTSSTCGCCT